MKSFNRAVDRFCARHPKFGVPRLMLYIIIGNVIVYMFSAMDRTGTFVSYLFYIPDFFLHGEVWRIITFIFIPNSSNILFFAISLYFYYFIGSSLEKQWGSGKFTIYYLSGVILLILYASIMRVLGYFVIMDSSYLNLSMFFAFATFFPEARVLLFFIIPIKIKWLALLDAAFFLYAIIAGTFPSNLIPLVATLNFFIFCGGTLINAFKPLKYKYSHQSVNFRHETSQAKRRDNVHQFERRCSVCGRTDKTNPELDFRFCSKCQGYHCFCQEHINSHVHFTE